MAKIGVTTCFLCLSFLSCQSGAKAETITCIFTEPYASTTYDTRLKTVAVTYDVENRRERLRNVSLRRTGPGVFQL